MLSEPVLIHYFQSPSTKLSPSFWRVSPSFLSKLLFILVFQSQENPSYPTICSMLHLEKFHSKNTPVTKVCFAVNEVFLYTSSHLKLTKYM